MEIKTVAKQQLQMTTEYTVVVEEATAKGLFWKIILDLSLNAIFLVYSVGLEHMSQKYP
jgi:hypothetical protein